MIKYKTYCYFKPAIDRVEIIKETDKYVFFKDRREAKCNGHKRYFDSFEDAKSFLVGVYKDRLRRSIESLHSAERSLEYIKNIDIKDIK